MSQLTGTRLLILSLAAVAAGLYLFSIDQAAAGTAVLAAPLALLGLKAVKTPPGPPAALLVGALALATSCSGLDPTLVSVYAIDAPTRRVCDRHDAYVNADPALDELEREIYLGTTDNLRRVLDEASK